MSPQEYEAVKEQVLGTLSELGALNSNQLVNATKKLLEEEGRGLNYGRRYLLGLVARCAGICVACDRHQQRVRPSVAEGVLDAPMFLYDYPGYTETMAARPLAGMPEVLLSQCGTCTQLEQHFLPALHPVKANELIPLPGACVYEPRFDGKRVTLPVLFQTPNNGLASLGTAGQVLDRILIDLGERRQGWSDKQATVYITSSMLCPSVKDDGSNGSVRVAERKACAPWLTLQIAIVDPPVIICLGAEAMGRFHSAKTPVADEAGKMQNISNRLIAVTWHPSMVVRNIEGSDSGRYYHEIREHIKGFLKAAREPRAASKEEEMATNATTG